METLSQRLRHSGSGYKRRQFYAIRYSHPCRLVRAPQRNLPPGATRSSAQVGSNASGRMPRLARARTSVNSGIWSKPGSRVRWNSVIERAPTSSRRTEPAAVPSRRGTSPTSHRRLADHRHELPQGTEGRERRTEDFSTESGSGRAEARICQLISIRKRLRSFARGEGHR